MQVIDFVRVSQPLTIASPAPEASTKAENQLNFNSLSEKVRLLATWIPATRQIIDDLPELMGFLNSSLPYYVNLGEELQLLSGDGTGENLHGLIPQATPFHTFAVAGRRTTESTPSARPSSKSWSRKELMPTFVILHPSDWWTMRLLKDTLGQLSFGRRAEQHHADAVRSGCRLQQPPSRRVNSSSATELRPLLKFATGWKCKSKSSTEHSTYFVQNMVAIRAEKRLALIVKRPASYVVGSFSGSITAVVAERFAEVPPCRKRTSIQSQIVDDEKVPSKATSASTASRTSAAMLFSRAHSVGALAQSQCVPLLWQHKSDEPIGTLTLHDTSSSHCTSRQAAVGSADGGRRLCCIKAG